MRHIQSDGAGGGGGEVNAVCVQHICACVGGDTMYVIYVDIRRYARICVDMCGYM